MQESSTNPTNKIMKTSKEKKLQKMFLKSINELEFTYASRSHASII